MWKLAFVLSLVLLALTGIPAGTSAAQLTFPPSMIRELVVETGAEIQGVAAFPSSRGAVLLLTAPVPSNRRTWCPTEEDVPTLWKFTSQNQLDSSFGAGGKLRLPNLGSFYGISEVVEDEQGRLYLAGSLGDYESNSLSCYATGYRPLVLRLESNGSLDSTFKYLDLSNELNALIPGDGELRGLLSLVKLTRDTYVSTTNAAHAVSFNNKGEINRRFGVNGLVTFPKSKLLATNLLRTPGSLYAVGGIYDEHEPDWGVVKLSAQGVEDQVFLSKSQGVYYDGDVGYFLSQKPVQLKGKIYVFGTSINYPTSYMRVIAIRPDGKLDSTFGTKGEFKLPFVGQIYAAFEDSCGGLLFPLKADGTSVGVIRRLTASGQLDTSFGSGGDFTLNWEAWAPTTSGNFILTWFDKEQLHVETWKFHKKC